MAPPPRDRVLLDRVLREPLLHFLLAGAALFALERTMRADDVGDADESSRIVVDAAARAEIADAWAHQYGHAPTPAELDAAIDRWIDDEVLYREGLSRGLDREDPRVRARIASNMAFVLEAQVTVPEPTDDELRAFFDERSAQWAEDDLIDFVHVFVTGHDDAARARADEILTQLRGGASPNGLGDTFYGGRRYRRRRVADLAESFGEELARGVDAQAEGTWALHRSRFGIHLVRIEGRVPAHAADFDAVRLDVRREWELARRAAEATRAMERLRERWEIVDER